MSGTDFLADQNAGGAGKAAEEGKDHSLKSPQNGGRRDGLIDLMAKDDIDHHIADADQNLIEENGKALADVVFEKREVPAEMRPDIRDVGNLSYYNKKVHDPDIDKTRNDRPQGCAPDTHGRKAKLSENQNIVADTVGNDTAYAADQGNLYTLNGAKESRHCRDNDLKWVGDADNSQVLDANGLDFRTVCIQRKDDVRMKHGHEATEQAGNHHKRERHPIGPADSVVVLRTPVLRKEKRTAANESPVP